MQYFKGAREQRNPGTESPVSPCELVILLSIYFLVEKMFPV